MMTTSTSGRNLYCLDRAVADKQEIHHRVDVEAGEHSLADDIIVKAIAAQNQMALSELYSRYASVLMGVAYKILHNRTDAEDLIHDVFLEVWKKAKNYDQSRGKVKSWLILVTRSRALDRLRSLSLAKNYAMAIDIEIEPIAQRSDPDVAMDQTLVREAVEKLDEPQRHVLLLSYFEGLSCQEISNRSNTPLGTVKSRLRASVQKLKQMFDANGEPA